jgi:hypothetical protein
MKIKKIGTLLVILLLIFTQACSSAQNPSASNTKDEVTPNASPAPSSQFESSTEQSYAEVVNLDIFICEPYNASYESKIKYIYDGHIYVTEDDIVDCDIEPNVPYRGCADFIEGAQMNISSDADVVEYLTGKQVSQHEAESIIENLSTFITNENSFEAILAEFQSIGDVSVEGNKDHFKIVIPDVTKCAESMGVRERILAFMLGYLHIYGGNAEFDGVTCIMEN